MITVKIIGGLGNQMFQYAFARGLALKQGVKFEMDLTFLMNKIPRPKFTHRKFLLNNFNIVESYTLLSKLAKYAPNISFLIQYSINNLKKIFKWRYVEEKSFSLENVNKNIYFDGYWQNEKYFKEFRDIICKDFSLKKELSGLGLEYLKKISSCNSVSIHVRRGDYVKLNLSEICNSEYYNKSIEYIKKNTKDHVFFIFSDDIQWVKNNLRIESEHYFIDGNLENPCEDLVLMNSCKHNIIANSSFSWWGAWLNKNSNKIVISPQKWSQELEVPSILSKNFIIL